MNFLDGILKNLGICEDVTPLPYRAAVLGGKLGYFENVKGIKSYKKDEVVLYLKKGEITVRGEGLTIGKYCMGDILILGEITEFSVKKV